MRHIIGIPVWNDAQNLKSLLSRLNGMELKVVIIGGGDDGTQGLLERNSLPNVHCVVERTRCGKPVAINRLLKLVQTEVIVFANVDSVFTKKDIDLLLEPFHSAEVGGSFARVYPANSKGMFGFWSELLCNEAHKKRLACSWLMCGGLLAVRRELIDSIPEDSLNDDAEMGLILKEKGYKIVYVPEAKVYLDFPDNLRWFFLQRRRTFVGFKQLSTRHSIKNVGRSMREESKGSISTLAYCDKPQHLLYLTILGFTRAILWMLTQIDYKDSVENPLKMWRLTK